MISLFFPFIFWKPPDHLRVFFSDHSSRDGLKGPLAKEDSNSQQRMRAMTWNALRYLPICEAMSTHRSSEDYS